MQHRYEEQGADFGRELGRHADEMHDNASGRSRQLAQTAADEARRLKELAGDQALRLRDQCAAQARHVKEQAREWVDRGSQRARDGMSELQDQALTAGRRADRYVHDEPYKTALVAVAAGALVGGLLVWLLREPRR